MLVIGDLDCVSRLGSPGGGSPCVLSGPSRVHVHDVWSKCQDLPADVVYIGHGHFSHRLPVRVWECPFRVGRDGSPHEVVINFLDWFQKSKLSKRLPELTRKRLACDCFHHQRSSTVSPSSRGRASRLLLSVMIGLRVRSATVSQASVTKSVANLLPDAMVLALH